MENSIEEEEQILTVKTCFLGPPFVGKTSIINAIFLDPEENQGTPQPSTGCNNFNYLTTHNGNRYDFKYWDTPGQQQYADITKFSLRNSQIIVLVYAIDDRETFKEIQKIYNNVTTDVADPATTQFIIVANKNDLKDKRQVNDDEGSQLATQLNATFISTSAEKMAGIKQLQYKIEQCGYNCYEKTQNEVVVDNNKPIKLDQKKDENDDGNFFKNCC